MSLTRPPYKRKRRSKKNAALHEDDDDTVDTVTHVKVEVNMKHRPKTKRIKVPLTTSIEEQGLGVSMIILILLQVGICKNLRLPKSRVSHTLAWSVSDTD